MCCKKESTIEEEIMLGKVVHPGNLWLKQLQKIWAQCVMSKGGGMRLEECSESP